MAEAPKVVRQVASTLELFGGLNVSTIFELVVSGIKSFGDKKERLKALELVALVTRAYKMSLNDALRDKSDDTSLEVMKALSRADDEVLLLMARTADLDGSTESIITQMRRQES